MPSAVDAMDIFLNSIRQNVDDIRQSDVDGNTTTFRASQSYWIDEGWVVERWKNYGVPQIGVFAAGGGVIAEGRSTHSERYEQKIFLVDIFASGKDQRGYLTEQVKDAFLLTPQRMSLLSSGLKVDKLLSEVDIIDDDILEGRVYRKQLTFRTIFRASGS